MKRKIIKFLLASVCLLGSTNMSAHDVEIKNADGVTIYYNYTNNGTELAVTFRGDNYYSSNEYTDSVVIPESVTYEGSTYPVTAIGDYAFHECYRLTSVTIGNSVTSISSFAFYYCSSLTEVTIPNSVTYIGDCAFNNCSSLTSVTIGNSVTTIGESAFQNCSSLTEVIIPNSVTYIGHSAFSRCGSLTEVTIGNSVTTIGNSAFNYCSSLTEVTIPNSVTSIGSYAFGYCNGLTSVTIGNSVTAIDDYTFYYCSSLTKVTIPNSVTSIGRSAFYDCGLTSVTIGNNVTSIGDHAFYYCDLTEITIPNSVAYISHSAFEDCRSLNFVTIGSGVLSIGYDAFNKAPLAKVIWLTNTPPSGYGYANGIVNYVANEQYTSLQNKAIYPFLSSMFEVDGLKYVPVSPSERTCDVIGYSYNKPTESIHIGNTVTNMGIDLTIQQIGPGAFYGCSSLISISVSNNVNSIGNYAFSGCSKLQEVVLADGTTELQLGSNGSKPMFANCPLNTVYIGRNISYNTSSSYGYSPFYRNTTLTTVTITDVETEIPTNEFYGCTSLKNVTIGEGVTTIGDWAFSGCSSLDSFEYGSAVKTIGQEAFSDCTAMTKLISHAATPPTCGSQALDDINKWNCTLSIPKGYTPAYQQADQWKEFFFINDDLAVPEADITEKKAEAEAAIAEAQKVYEQYMSDYNTDSERMTGYQSMVKSQSSNSALAKELLADIEALEKTIEDSEMTEEEKAAYQKTLDEIKTSVSVLTKQNEAIELDGFSKEVQDFLATVKACQDNLTAFETAVSSAKTIEELNELIGKIYEDRKNVEAAYEEVKDKYEGLKTMAEELEKITNELTAQNAELGKCSDEVNAAIKGSDFLKKQIEADEVLAEAQKASNEYRLYEESDDMKTYYRVVRAQNANQILADELLKEIEALEKKLAESGMTADEQAEYSKILDGIEESVLLLAKENVETFTSKEFEAEIEYFYVIRKYYDNALVDYKAAIWHVETIEELEEIIEKIRESNKIAEASYEKIKEVYAALDLETIEKTLADISNDLTELEAKLNACADEIDNYEGNSGGNDDNTGDDGPVVATSITLPETAIVNVGNTLQLKPTIEPADAKTELTWASDDESVATVSTTGDVRGIKAGKATISVRTSNGLVAKCLVEVQDVTSIKYVNADGSNVPVYNMAGQKVNLPANAKKGVYIVNGKKVVVK